MQANALFQNRPPLWLYYENPYYQWRRPEYLNLCLETVQRHCGRSFRVIPLTRYDVYKYLPDLRKDVWVKCTAAQRMDLIRWELLSRYGGLCLDPDVLVAGDLRPYMEQLTRHDFVAFGCGTSEGDARDPAVVSGHGRHLDASGRVGHGLAATGHARQLRAQPVPLAIRQRRAPGR